MISVTLQDMKEMSFLSIEGKNLCKYIDSKLINESVQSIGRKISQDYGEEQISILCVLNGAFMFAADLMRSIASPCEISFIRLSSYEGTETTGKVRMVNDIPDSLSNRHVLIVEDIVDTGITMNFLINEVKKLQPKSIKVATMFDKPSRRKCHVHVDYIGLTIEDKFIVGYGLDYNGLFRNLPDIYTK